MVRPSRKVKEHILHVAWQQNTSPLCSHCCPVFLSFCSSRRDSELSMERLDLQFRWLKGKMRSRATGRYCLKKIHHLLWNTVCWSNKYSHLDLPKSTKSNKKPTIEQRRPDCWLHKEQHPYEYILNAHTCAILSKQWHCSRLLQGSPRPALQWVCLSWTSIYCNYHIKRWDVDDMKESFHHNGLEARFATTSYDRYVMTGSVPKLRESRLKMLKRGIYKKGTLVRAWRLYWYLNARKI